MWVPSTTLPGSEAGSCTGPPSPASCHASWRRSFLAPPRPDCGSRRVPLPIIAGQARDATLRAERFLVGHQDADGFFREYSLKPGRSEDWTTSLIGHALARAPAAAGPVLALAALALHGAWR